MTDHRDPFEDLDRFTDPAANSSTTVNNNREDSAARIGIIYPVKTPEMTQESPPTNAAAEGEQRKRALSFHSTEEKEVKRIGRPKVYILTQEIEDSICHWIENGGTVTKWAEEHNIPVRHVWWWGQESAVFYSRMQRSRALRTHAHIEQVIDMADQVTEDPDVTVAQVKARELSSKYRTWLSGMLNRADYGPQDAKVGTNISFNIDLSGGPAPTLTVTQSPQQQNNTQQHLLAERQALRVPRGRPHTPPTPHVDHGPVAPGHEDS